MSLSRPALAVRALLPSLITALLWCAAAASVVFWVLQFPQEKPAWSVSEVPVGGATTADIPAKESDPGWRVWGVKGRLPEPALAASGRYQLWGVVADASGRGSALIAIDGQPPKAYRVGQALSEGVYLQSLSQRQAQIGVRPEGPSLFALTLPSTDKAP